MNLAKTEQGIVQCVLLSYCVGIELHVQILPVSVEYLPTHFC